MENLRIGFSGPSGSGKTTLATWLSKEIGIPFIASSASLMISEEDRENLHKKYNYTPQGHKYVIAMSNAIPDFGIDFQTALISQRIKLLKEEIKKGNPFIVDRTMIDNAAYFLMQCSPHATEEKTESHLTTCITGLYEIFTHLFLVKPNENWTEDNGSRVNNNHWQNLVVWPTFYNVFYNFAGKSTLFGHGNVIKAAILETWDLDIRKQVVLNAISHEQEK